MYGCMIGVVYDVHTGYKSWFEFFFCRKTCVFSDNPTKINKTPIHEIMGQNTNDLITYVCP